VVRGSGKAQRLLSLWGPAGIEGWVGPPHRLPGCHGRLHPHWPRGSPPAHDPDGKVGVIRRAYTQHMEVPWS